MKKRKPRFNHLCVICKKAIGRKLLYCSKHNPSSSSSYLAKKIREESKDYYKKLKEMENVCLID